MSDARKLVSIIKKATTPDGNALTDIVMGTVLTISPVSVQLGKIVLTESFLIVPADRDTMQIGDTLQLLRVKQGQKYYILDNTTRRADVIATDSDKLEGKHAALATTADTIPIRDANGNLFANSVGLSVSDATAAATHYMVETASDGYIRPKTLANVKAEVVLAADIMTKIKTVDGAGSGLDADTVDGIHAATIVQDGAVLMSTNVFGGRKLYINSMDNAMWAAEAKWDVVATLHLISYGGETYPKLNPAYVAEYAVTGSGTSFAITGAPASIVVFNNDSLCTPVTTPTTQYQYTYVGGTLTFGATVTGTIRAYPDVDVVQYLDSPVASTITQAKAAALFDGSYESFPADVASGYYIKVRISPVADGKTPFTSVLAGAYPYGQLLLSYYNTSVPAQSYYRVYNRAFRQHGIGWKQVNFASFVGTTINRIDYVYDVGNYGRTVMEFVIVTGAGACWPTQIDWNLSRPALLTTGCTLVKHGINQLYKKMQWRTKTEVTAEIDPDTGLVKGKQLQSTVPSGTAPLVVASPTLVPNLNADKLDGNDATAFALAPSKTNWTPADASGAGLTLTNVVQATYFRVGKMVHMSFDIQYPTTTNGAYSMVTLPVAADDLVCGAVGFNTYGSSITYTNGNFYDLSGNALTNAQMSGKRVRVSATYIATS